MRRGVGRAGCGIAYGHVLQCRGRRSQELERLAKAARYGHPGLRINAGHGLNTAFDSIFEGGSALGHLEYRPSIVARAVMVGMERAVREIKELMA